VVVSFIIKPSSNGDAEEIRRKESWCHIFWICLPVFRRLGVDCMLTKNSCEGSMDQWRQRRVTDGSKDLWNSKKAFWTLARTLFLALQWFLETPSFVQKKTGIMHRNAIVCGDFKPVCWKKENYITNNKDKCTNTQKTVPIILIAVGSPNPTAAH
jgi:hypothetical protein